MPPARVAARRIGVCFLVSFSLALAAPPARADSTTDCFADRIAALLVGTVTSPPAFNTWQPGMVLGPPGNATPTSGSLSVV